MKISFSLCFILVCIGLSVVSVEGKRTTKSRSYSSKNTYYHSSSSSSSEEDTDRTYCELLDLPQTCTLEYVPVCAHIRGCEGDDCFVTAGNVCGACKDGTYDYFVSGECPGKPEQEEESSEDGKLYCELVDFPGVCPPVWNPVCAHLRDCEGDNCFETVGDGCTACNSKGKYDYFVSGKCHGDVGAEQEEEGGSEDNILRCELLDVPAVCPARYDPVCAHLRNCEGDNCSETVSNGCTACSSEGKYDYFVGGECPKQEEEDKLYCELLDVPQVCPASYDPVCAHLRDCEGDNCSETVSNGCTACSSEGKYDYFVSGECQIDGGAEQEEEGGLGDDALYCELLDLPAVCPAASDPVCAHVRNCEGDGCFDTVGNGCLACSWDGKYDYFVSGECQEDGHEEGDDILYCELLDVPQVCPASYDPVCAHLRDCEGENCSETVSNGCTACSSEGKYDSFVGGECPKKEEEDKLYCELLDVPQVCTQIYDPVCAHLRNCEGDHCSETVSNGCTACSSEGKYDYFVGGECPEENRLYCDLVDVPQVCTQIYDPVCAHLRNCEGEGCLRTEGNGCTACSQGGKYDYLVPGECPEPEKKSCDENDRPDFCTKEYFPVCAHHYDGDEHFTTAGNPCMACFDHTVDYYTFGSC